MTIWNLINIHLLTLLELFCYCLLTPSSLCVLYVHFSCILVLLHLIVLFFHSLNFHLPQTNLTSV